MNIIFKKDEVAFLSCRCLCITMTSEVHSQPLVADLKLENDINQISNFLNIES